jgi:hypothetical protein
MSTTVATLPAASRLPGRRYDRVFFLTMSLLILAAVFLGFARTYYLAGLVHAPLPSWIIHVHGAIFSTWIILLLVQTSLVSAGRVDIHKKLGLFAFGLSCVMVVFGLMAARNSLLRGFVPPGFPMSAQTFFVIPVTDIFMFATLIYFGWALRTNSSAHKRLMIVATVSILDAAIDRWPFAYIQHGHIGADLTVFSFLFLLMFYDLWSTHKIQRATLWASVFVIVIEEIRVPLATSHLWIRFADLVAGKV